jgi:hypothetical protein
MGVVENGKFGRNAELCPSICHARLASYDSPQRVVAPRKKCPSVMTLGMTQSRHRNFFIKKGNIDKTLE